MRKTTSLVLAFMALTITPCLADDLRDGIKAYNHGDYATAYQLLQARLSDQPQDPTAHYYLANTLVKLGDKKEATKEYTTFLMLNRDSAAAEYARRALAALKAGKETTQTAAKSEPPKVVSQTEVDALTDRLMHKYDSYFAAKRKELEQQEARINADMERQIAKLYPTETMRIASVTVNLPTDDYTTQELRIRDAAQKKIDALEDAFNAEQVRVREVQRKAALRELTAKYPTATQQKQIAAAEIDARTEQLMSKYDAYFNRKHKELDAYKEKVMREADDRISKVPQVETQYLDREPIVMNNPDYGSLTDAIRKEAQDKIRAKEDALKAEEDRVREAQRKIAIQQIKDEQAKLAAATKSKQAARTTAASTAVASQPGCAAPAAAQPAGTATTAPATQQQPKMLAR